MIHCNKCNRSYKNCNFNKHNCNKKEIKFRVSATGRKYGVSDNTIRKWIKYNGGTQLTEVHRLENG